MSLRTSGHKVGAVAVVSTPPPHFSAIFSLFLSTSLCACRYVCFSVCVWLYVRVLPHLFVAVFLCVVVCIFPTACGHVLFFACLCAALGAHVTNHVSSCVCRSARVYTQCLHVFLCSSLHVYLYTHSHAYLCVPVRICVLVCVCAPFPASLYACPCTNMSV
jgi:hypothetical protein